MCFWRLLLFHTLTDPALRLPPFCGARHWKSEIISQKIPPVPAHHEVSTQAGVLATVPVASPPNQRITQVVYRSWSRIKLDFLPLSPTHTHLLFLWTKTTKAGQNIWLQFSCKNLNSDRSIHFQTWFCKISFRLACKTNIKNEAHLVCKAKKSLKSNTTGTQIMSTSRTNGKHKRSASNMRITFITVRLLAVLPPGEQQHGT